MTQHRALPCVCLSAFLAACASAPAPAPEATPAPAAEPGTADPLAPYALPAFPFDREAASLDFRRGAERAERMLASPLASPPEDADGAAFETWLKTDLLSWLTGSARELDQIQRALAPVVDGDEAEAIVASTLVALCWQRVHDHFVTLPPPPEAKGDPEEVAHYRDGLEQAAAQWLQQAAGTFAFCANRAKQAGEARLEPWLAYCSERYEAAVGRMAALQEKMAAALEAQAAAARGPRPPGPEACWTPSQGRGPARPKREPDTPAPALVVLDNVEPSRVPLLGAERARFVEALRQRLATRYAEAGVQTRWLDARELKKLEAEWQRGKRLTGAGTCARGVGWLEFLRASYPNLELASAWSNCEDEACELQVDLGDRGAASVLGYRRLEAKLALPLSDAEHWLQALETLAPVQGDAASLLSGLGRHWRAPGGEPLTVHRLELHGEWPDPEAAQAVLTGSELAKCADTDAGDDGDVMAVLDVAPSGTVREVWQAPGLSAGRARQRCAAKVLSALRFAKGEGARRIGVTVGLGRGVGQTARDAAYGAVDLGTGVRVSVASDDNLTLSPAPLHGPATASELAACFARHASEPDAPLALRASVRVAPNGKAQKASVEHLDENAGKVDAELGRCLSRALARTAFDCSADKKPAQVQATVCMVRDGDDEASAKAPAKGPADAKAPAPAKAPADGARAKAPGDAKAPVNTAPAGAPTDTQAPADTAPATQKAPAQK